MAKFDVKLRLEATYTIEAEDQKEAEELADDFANDIDENTLQWMGKEMVVRAEVGDVEQQPEPQKMRKGKATR